MTDMTEIVLNHTVHPKCQSRPEHILLLKVGIPKVCRFILGIQSVVYHFWSHCDPDLYLWLQF